MEILIFCMKFNTFLIPISDCVTMQQSTVLIFFLFFHVASQNFPIFSLEY